MIQGSGLGARIMSKPMSLPSKTGQAAFFEIAPGSFAKPAQIAIRVKQKQKRCKTGKKQTVEDRVTSLERAAL